MTKKKLECDECGGKMRIFDSRHIASMDIQYDVDASKFILRVERLGLAVLENFVAFCT